MSMEDEQQLEQCLASLSSAVRNSRENLKRKLDTIAEEAKMEMAAEMKKQKKTVIAAKQKEVAEAVKNIEAQRTSFVEIRERGNACLVEANRMFEDAERTIRNTEQEVRRELANRRRLLEDNQETNDQEWEDFNLSAQQLLDEAAEEARRVVADGSSTKMMSMLEELKRDLCV